MNPEPELRLIKFVISESEVHFKSNALKFKNFKENALKFKDMSRAGMSFAKFKDFSRFQRMGLTGG